MIIPYLTDPLINATLILIDSITKSNQYLQIFNCYLPIFSLCLYS